MILQTAVLSVLLCSVHSFTLQASFEKSDENSGNTIEDEDVSISALLEKANANAGKNLNGSRLMFGDILVPTDLKNADPCTRRGCMWPKSRNGKVYVPYCLSNQYSRSEKKTIIKGLQSFSASTCIRFIPRKRQKDFLNIYSDNGCYSFLGRQRGSQTLSLQRRGCTVFRIVQHELLHALGFHHEQSRSDRDEHVRILWENIKRGKSSQFRKVDTRNLNTPYDYNSVMHYGRKFFSGNGKPTIVPIPNPNVPIGEATRMSSNDILRVNRLYGC
ncbi:high choriolytic enzyme 2-like [Embiotoca jacksoni]|uniref:high choriolytic enzyme 2-like n=1 Tax=Embiotoca jacksoni TaxID=100190 RepID=UPI003703A12B